MRLLWEEHVTLLSMLLIILHQVKEQQKQNFSLKHSVLVCWCAGLVVC